MSLATQVGPDTFVTLSYTLYDEDGDVLDRVDGETPVSYVQGYGQIVPGLERGVEGMSKGDARSIVVSAEDGYGEYDPEGVVEVDRSEFPRPETVIAGDEFIAESSTGDAMPLTVLEVRDDACVVDTNHPLAGEVLRFEVTVLDVRPATAGEIELAAQALEQHDHEHPHDHDCDHEHPHDHDHDHAALVSIGKKPNERAKIS